MESVSGVSSMLDTARDLTVEAAQGGRFNSRAVPRELGFSQIKKLLESRHEREILEGLRRVISPCLPYFSPIIKNVASPNVEVKKLVYIYLLHYAESEPDLALLSVNAIQKSLSDQNPQVRAMALKVMSGIRVPVISQIVSLAIKKGCADMSPHVRKAAALAVPKCYKLDPGTLPQLLDYLSGLLGDKQYFVVGSAVTAFLEVCPDRLDLIHKHYRSLVRKLIDMDDWGQLAVLRLMTYYSRRCFPHADDPDLQLFLGQCRSLATSRNPAVVVAVARAFLALDPQHLDAVVGPLAALLRCPPQLQQAVLYNLVAICMARPTDFLPYWRQFLVNVSDNAEVWRVKLELLTLIFPHGDFEARTVVLSELENLARSTDPNLARESVQAIGRCAQHDEKTSQWCLSFLLRQALNEDELIVAEALGVVRQLIQSDPDAHKNTIVQLAKTLDTVTDSNARSSIIWLVGEFSGDDMDDSIAPDVLRLLVQGFAEEGEAAKTQILLLAAKVYTHFLDKKGQEPSHEPAHPIASLWEHVLLLVKYDTSYSLRDRARMLQRLLEDTKSTQMANLVLMAPKPVPKVTSPSERRKDILLGTTSLITGELCPGGVSGYEPLPDWVKDGDQPDPKLREEPISAQAPKSAARILDSALQKKKQESSSAEPKAEKSLDDWLAEEEEEEESETETESGETETDSEGSTETESDESDEELLPNQ